MMVTLAPGIEAAVRLVSSGVQEKSYSPVRRYSGQTPVSIRCDLAAQVAVDAIEIEVALEHARAALLVGPQRLVARGFRALRSDQSGDQRGADLAAMNVRRFSQDVSYQGCWKSAASSPISARNSAAWSIARLSTMRPPIEQPITTGLSSFNALQKARMVSV